MRIKTIILLPLFIVSLFIGLSPAISFSYTPSIEPITQYIIDLSKDIYNSIKEPRTSVLFNSKGEIKLRLLLSPWGELKDAYIYESSGNKELDDICLKTVWMHKRYQPFPEELGDSDRWVDIPIIFDMGKLSSSETIDIFKTTKVDPKEFPTLDINEAVDIALDNRMAAKIAEEEVSLSRLKIREARRALYPAATLNYLETTGKTTSSVLDFTDKEYKVNFEYPVYYGWRLKYAVEQAISNMKASRHNYEKVVQDLRLEVELAFYSYIITKSSLALQSDLLKKAEGIFDIAKKRFDRDLTTRSEFLQVHSQLKQIAYQLTSSENDMNMAKLSLSQAMNVENLEDLEDLIDIDMNTDLRVLDLDIGVEKCIDLAFKYRPDLKSKEYMVDFNDYERKIARSKDQLKVDLTGSYGRSGGAYESESLNLDKDWYFGLKVSKPLGGNTLSTSYTKDETSEKHGQVSRTESVSRGAELGILDNLQSFSEKKSSEIALKKSKEELQQTKDAVFKEVKESYLNYKKGLIQAKANLDKIGYREEALRVAKAQAELNELPFSELLQAHMNLFDEKSFYIEAVGSLYQSLTRLNKATGYSLFLYDESFMLADAK